MTSTWKGVMVRAGLLAALCASVWADCSLDKSWDLWKKIHQKTYKDEVEEMGRRALWEKNLNEINVHNLEASLGLHTYTLGINHMSDLTKDEIVAPLTFPEELEMTPTPLEETRAPLPPSVDWRTKGYVTSVKDQGHDCGSCYAFSAAGALEGLLKKTTGKLVELSPQNLMDCTAGPKYGNSRCYNGKITPCFQYVIDNKGIDSEASYPYEAKNRTCRYNPKYSEGSCSSFGVVPGNEQDLQKAVATIGPISAQIDATDIQRYSSGVYNNPSCKKDLNHSVLVVGYGTDQKTKLDYWLIKNSWGQNWGEQGYIRLARNKGQMCGISKFATYPK